MRPLFALAALAAPAFLVAFAGCSTSKGPAASAAAASTGNDASTATPSTDSGSTASDDPSATVAYPNAAAACASGVDLTGFWGLAATGLGDVSAAKLCQYAGKVVLVVNVASKCGYTPQYEGLQAIYAKYAKQGFTVLGFPCNQFGGQEPGDAGNIREVCTGTYHVTFPIFEKVDVNGSTTDPVFAWLKSQPGGSGDIGWNFTKFLVGRDGKLVARWASQIEPESAAVTGDIEAALAVAR